MPRREQPVKVWRVTGYWDDHPHPKGAGYVEGYGLPPARRQRKYFTEQAARYIADRWLAGRPGGIWDGFGAAPAKEVVIECSQFVEFQQVRCLKPEDK